MALNPSNSGNFEHLALKGLNFIYNDVMMTTMMMMTMSLLTGTVGNLTSLAVLLRPRMRGKSVYLFLLLLAIADTMVLYISAFKTWIRNITGFELLSVSNWSCRSVTFLTLLSTHMAAWIVVLVTTDRFIAVWFPLRATSWCTVTRASIATYVCTVLVAIYRSFDIH